MNDSDIWTVDRLAAQNLLADLKLADLKLEAPADLQEQLAGHFARHRRTAQRWAAHRVHANTVKMFESNMLEEASRELFTRKDEEWHSGYRHAEEQLVTMRPEDLLDLGPKTNRSKGQILRNLVRQAKMA